MTSWHPSYVFQRRRFCVVQFADRDGGYGVADIRETFRLEYEDNYEYEDDYEYEFSELSKLIGFGQLNLGKCACSKLKCRIRGPSTPI